ncbi:CBM35 domain-containing protein [Streptomyces sp. NPDC001691]|uniref:CBM35 domain-containing protein n=1 Tax=unclassified Streptomyces TaxID=2593676 RepID=UPI000DE9167E|nr:CBM35 domain-containing protein [Streptomyces sp. SDr-06]RCH66011.1 carbohydrate-binding protein [Streptomyces sp. SDr-06]
MTTPGNNGANTPEDDDPFGYLYEDGQASGATPPRTGGGYGYPGPTVGHQQPGVPRTSYNQVRTVGERQYGQIPQQQYQGPPQQQYGQPTAQYAAPETYPGGAPPRQGPPPQQNGGGGRGPNTKGLLIGAVAVVAAVVIGIAVALASNSGDKDKKDNTANPGATTSGQPTQPSTNPSPSASAPASLPKDDAATLTLGGSAQVGTNVPGAQGTGGAFVGNFNSVGASVTWKPNVPKAGSYKLNLRFGIPGTDANATITINGKPESRPMNMKNFAHSPAGDWAKGWQSTYALVQLDKGANEIKLSCEQGNQCNANLDQVWLTPA